MSNEYCCDIIVHFPFNLAIMLLPVDAVKEQQAVVWLNVLLTKEQERFLLSLHQLILT